MDTISIVKNDTASSITLELIRDSSGEAFDAQTATPKLHIRRKGSTSVIVSITYDEDISDLAAGSIGFELDNFLSSSSVTDGYYEGEIEIVFDNGSRQTVFEILNFRVREDFA